MAHSLHGNLTIAGLLPVPTIADFKVTSQGDDSSDAPVYPTGTANYTGPQPDQSGPPDDLKNHPYPHGIG